MREFTARAALDSGTLGVRVSRAADRSPSIGLASVFVIPSTGCTMNLGG
jgi:hypothetical protein